MYVKGSCIQKKLYFETKGYNMSIISVPPIVSITGIENADSLEEGSGGALAMRCRAEGNPPPSAWWTRSSPRPLPTANPTDTLLLAPLTRNHSGIVHYLFFV